MKDPARAGSFVLAYPIESCSNNNVACLKAFGPLFHLVGNRLPFAQRFETRTLDRIEMYEHIIAAIVLGNKPVSFGFVKPRGFNFEVQRLTKCWY
jgi:hypothetical protein